MSTNSDSTPQHVKALTRFPIGSIREISTLSFPLMLSALSTALMMFFDRYILAQYSLEAMNASVGASLSIWVFQVLLLGIAGISEVFVGQYHGAKQFERVASPVWQMIWFSLFLGFILYPIAFLIPEWFVPEEYHADGAIYFKWVLSFSWLVGVNTALTAFYVGRGKVRLITTIVVIANILNVIGDYVLIFGINGWLPSLGILGAAWATILSQIFQFCILLTVFLSKHHRDTYSTHKAHFDGKEFKDCIKIGLPSALGHMVEIAAWSIQFHIMSHAGHLYATIVAIGQSVFGLVAFTTEGLNKAVIALASNLIGGKYLKPFSKIFRSAFVVHMIIACFLITPLIFHPEWLLDDFLSTETDASTIETVLHFSKLSCIWIFVYFVVDGLVWIAAGFLTAAKDTTFILITNAINSWVFALIPTYYVIVVLKASPEKAWMMISLYGVINMLCFTWRMRFKLFGDQPRILQSSTK